MRAGDVCGPDACDVDAQTPISFRPTPAAGTRIDIVSDAICPWCYIGKRQLERALPMPEGLRFSVHWNPFQLNPDMPAEGRDRMAYRAWKFGSTEKAAALDVRITEAAAAVGLPFRTDLMTRTPNTIQAHRLIWYAGQRGAQDAAIEAIFRAYFADGRDIGDKAVLADCAVKARLERAVWKPTWLATSPNRKSARRIKPLGTWRSAGCRHSSSMGMDCFPGRCRRRRWPICYDVGRWHCERVPFDAVCTAHINVTRPFFHPQKKLHFDVEKPDRIPPNNNAGSVHKPEHWSVHD